MSAETEKNKGYVESIFYESNDVKITNLRATCCNITIPINRIKDCYVNVRAELMTASFSVFIISFFLTYMTVNAFGAYGLFSLLFVAFAFFWAKREYSQYLELIISTGEKTVKVFDASMSNREHIYKIEKALKEAISETGQKTSDRPANRTSFDTAMLKAVVIE